MEEVALTESMNATFRPRSLTLPSPWQNNINPAERTRAIYRIMLSNLPQGHRFSEGLLLDTRMKSLVAYGRITEYKLLKKAACEAQYLAGLDRLLKRGKRFAKVLWGNILPSNPGNAIAIRRAVGGGNPSDPQRSPVAGTSAGNQIQVPIVSSTSTASTT